MTNFNQLLQSLISQEQQLTSQIFLAPALPGQPITVRLNNLLYRFDNSQGYEGWGIFQPTSTKSVKKLEAADPIKVAQYLQLFTTMRLILVYPLRGQTWLAYPQYPEVFTRHTQRQPQPVEVHLVTGGEKLLPITARYDGKLFWYEGRDSRSDIVLYSRLQDLFRRQETEFRLPQITPPMITAYTLAAQQDETFHQDRTEMLLRNAFLQGGGHFISYVDEGPFWRVKWSTSDGTEHNSTLNKDLSVITAGICLAGTDRTFDVQSLVNVVERRHESSSYVGY